MSTTNMASEVLGAASWGAAVAVGMRVPLRLEFPMQSPRKRAVLSGAL